MAQGQEIRANRHERLEAARSAFGAGDLSRAEELLQAALSDGPADWELLGLSGAVAIARGRAAAAIPMLTRALELVPPLGAEAGRVSLLNDLGNGYQRLGERSRAESHYRAALELNPQLPEVWNNLANLLSDSDRPSERQAASAAYQTALGLQPEFPAASANFAHFLQRLGDHRAAIAVFPTAIALNPRRAVEFRLAEAQSHRSLGNPQAALTLYRQSLVELEASGQASPATLRAYGLTLQEAAHSRQDLTQGLQWIVRGLIKPPGENRVAELLDLATGQANCADWAAAAATLSEALGLEPHNAAVQFQIARLAELQSNYDLAIDGYRALLVEDSSLRAARLNLGNCLVAAARGRLGTPESSARLCEAIAEFQTLLASEEPGREALAARLGLASARHLSGESRAAVAILDEALKSAPNHPLVQFNRANILQDLGDFAAAIAGFKALVEHYPDYHDARWNLAFAELVSGDYRQGFRNFEVRWQRAPGRAGLRQFDRPLWLGEAGLTPRTLLVHAEQGLGDSLQFCRFVPLLLQRGVMRVIFEVQPALVALMTESFAAQAPAITVVPRDPSYPRGDSLPPFDAHIPLMSLPLVFGTELDSLPTEIPYLQIAPARAARWRNRLESLAGSGKRIGLVWAGECRRDIPLAVETDRLRSVALAAFAPWVQRMTAAGVRIVSLQLGPPRSQLSEVEFGAKIIDPMADVEDFADTAAILLALDGLVTVDTSVAHAAGGLGLPVTILSRHQGCWRWLVGRSDSPWYPSARIIHQARPMDWNAEIASL
ncbi:MAG: tetratricopeptide repeat protein [Alphaproteobacteria bacterium]|nr:tetratricopeptide repeat protein [Alphaproteobacteria bacterium]